MLSIEQRLESCLRSWPKRLAADYRCYQNSLRRVETGRSARHATKIQGPYWILLPCWLMDLYQRQDMRPRWKTDFLSDITWAQYCLFLSIRIQDDLLDGQAGRRSLLGASERFRLEAEKTLSKYFGPRSRFWKFYRQFLRSTKRAIVQVDKLQRTLSSRPRKLLAGYGRVSSIFKVGSAAVCVKFKRMKDFVHVSSFADRMAIVGQIIDDLEDIEEDLRRSRFNFVASCLLRGAREEAARNQPREEFAERLVYDHCLDGVLAQARRQLELSRKALFPLGIAPMNEHIASYERALNEMSINFHRQRVGILFDGHPRFRGA